MFAHMHGALHTATASALAQAEMTVSLAHEFIKAVPSSQHDLEPVLRELHELRRQLQQIRENETPRILRSSLEDVITGISDVCRRMGDILKGCEDDKAPETCWALVGASAEIQQLQRILEHGRRTVQVAHRVPYPDNYPGVADDIEALQHEIELGTAVSYALIDGCLDAFKIHMFGESDSMQSEETAPMSPTSPSIQEMLLNFRRSSTHSSETGDSAICATDVSEDQAILDATRCSSHSHNVSREKQDQHWVEHQSLQPPPLKFNKRNIIPASPPAPNYSLFPPLSPPPAKALPPIPPRSLKRTRVTSALSETSAATNTAAGADDPPKSQARAHTDLPYQRKFTPPASVTDGTSRSSKSSSIPPRSSSRACQALPSSPRPDTVLSQQGSVDVEILALTRLEGEKDSSQGGVYSIETPSKATILASRHGKFHIKIWDLSSSDCFVNIKVPFYVQVQPRSREYFIRSHAILSETSTLIGIATGFGQTLEIWNWDKRKKVQTISDAMRWTAFRSDVYESRCPPLATYSDDDNAIKLYPVSHAKKPFGKPRVIDLRKAELPHLPKLPELAFSATGPLLVAAAGPRPPRPGNPPPAHSGLLLAWQLDGDPKVHKPYKYLHTVKHPELRNSLPLSLATYGSVAVSIWEAAKFRTIGREGMWQVEPVAITERVVLVWDFSGAVDRTSTYRIPNVLACVSPDCRFVVYCDPGGRSGSDLPGALVVLDATRGGKELWRLDGLNKEADATGIGMTARPRPASRWSRRSSEPKTSRRSSGQLSSGHGSEQSSMIVGAGGLEMLAADLKKVTELSFSGDGSQLFIGDIDGVMSVYEFRVDGLHATMSRD